MTESYPTATLSDPDLRLDAYTPPPPEVARSPILLTRWAQRLRVLFLTHCLLARPKGVR